MFDDLGRNFIMNPTAGLKIRPFRFIFIVSSANKIKIISHLKHRDAAINRDTDKGVYLFILLCIRF